MKLRYILLMALIVCGAQTARAQWQSDSTTNTAVCTASDIQQNPRVCTDGADGVIIVWEDHRNATDYDIFAQHLDANGNRMWGTNGVPVCRRLTDQRYPIIASDGSGGCYVVWQDYRTVANGIDLYAQRLQSDGTRVYDTSGIAIAAKVRDQTNPAITADGFGNAFVVWEDNRAVSSTTRPDIYMNELTPTGRVWLDSGKVIANQQSQQRHPKICEDGTGGVVVAWENSATLPQSIWASRVNSSGVLTWGGQLTGINVYVGGTGSNISRNIDLRRDGSQFMIAWEETTSNGQEIRANRLRLDSSKVWYSPADVTWGYAGDQINPQIFSDDSVGNSQFPNAGVMVVFQSLFGGSTLQFVRVLPNGSDLAPRAGTNYFNVCSVTGGQGSFAATKIGTGNLLIAWDDARAGANDTSIYVQRIDEDLQRYFPTYGTASDWGRPINVSSSNQARQVQFQPRANGAIAVWQDTRNGGANTDIYAQLILKDGTLPVELSTFNVRAQQGRVDLNWQTASEQNNAGFTIERRNANDASRVFTEIQSYATNPALHGHGPTNITHEYSAVDYPSQAGTYEYRLVDVALNGQRVEHQPEKVELTTLAEQGFSLSQNQPNPAIDHATIAFTLPQSALVDLTVSDVVGRTVSSPIAHQIYNAGGHSVGLDLAKFTHGISSGIYFYRLTAFDPSTGAMLWRNDKAIPMQVVR